MSWDRHWSAMRTFIPHHYKPYKKKHDLERIKRSYCVCVLGNIKRVPRRKTLCYAVSFQNNRIIRTIELQWGAKF